MPGYAGKILRVDLTGGGIAFRTLDPAFARPYIGAAGLAARLFFDMTLARRILPDPLSPENPLLIMTGPLQGTTLPGSGRFSVCARSPLTSFWGESNCGGDMGPFLKFAGFDGVIITGAASRPSVLWIEDGHAELRPAGDLWGKDTYDTADILGAAGGKRTKVFCIGPAGEHLVRYAAIVGDKRAAAGRMGMGAVMGAKLLKAIVVRGSGNVSVAQPEAFRALRRAVQEKIHDNLPLQSFRSFGTAASVYYNSLVGDLAVRNWRQGTFDDSALLGLDGTTMTDTILTGNSACYACPVACKREVEVTDGAVTRAKGAGPEYETIMGFGPMLMNADLPAIAQANERCNRLGVDTISCAATISFATEATERGLLHTDLAWGDSAPVLSMIDDIAHRSGAGDVLADGVMRAAARLGVAADADWVPHVKGSELPMHDPRCFYGIGVGYATSPRGANHNAANVYLELGSVIFPELGLDGDLSSRRIEGKAFLSAMSQRIGCIVDALTLCMFDSWGYNLEDMCRALNSVAGFDYDVPELVRAGERMWALKRSITNLFGATAADDRLPGRLLTPHAGGPIAGSAPDLPSLLKDFYDICGLDQAGRVSSERLQSLGLSDVAALLH